MKFPALTMLLISAATVSACAVTQPPAQVVVKGQNFYGTQGAPVQVAASNTSYQSRTVTAAPVAKPSMAAPVMQVTASEPRPSYGFQPSPDTTAVRERAELAQVSTKDLEPLTAAKSSPAPTASVQQVASNDAGIDPAAAAELAEQLAQENLATLPEPQARVVAETNIPAATAAPAAVSSKGFIWPVKGKVISGFGPRAGGEYNDGINIAAQQGEPIVAAADGEVVYSGNELRGYGNMIIVRHDNGLMTAYAHADRVLVSKGEQVRQGVTIATVGKSGGVEEAQVHFGVRKDKQPIDPMTVLNQSNFAAR